MATTFDFENLDQAAVADNADLIGESLKVAYPDFEVRRGPVRELVIEPSAVAATGAALAPIEVWRKSTSLLEIEADPTVAEPESVDRVLSNYRIERRAGATAVGNVVIVVRTATPFVVALGLQFTADGVLFVTENKYAAKTNQASFTQPTDRLLSPVGDGTYAVSIPVVAVEPGAAGNLKRNTRLVPDTAPRNFVVAYAESDFTGGIAEQTNAELVDLLQQGAAVKAYSNRITTEAMIRREAAFEKIIGISIVGAGDVEMVRDKHGLFPTAGGARIDVYLRSQALPQSLAATVTATLVDTADGYGIWQFSLTKDVLPAFYELTRIARPTDSEDFTGFEVLADDRQIVLDDTVWQPDIETVQEGAYSAFQASTIRFTDTLTAISGLTVGASTASYAVVGRCMPLVAELQAYLGGYDVRPPGDDVLVRGAVPCFTRVSLRIVRLESQEAPTTADIRTALANYVNSFDFAGALYASDLIRVTYGLLSEGMSIDQVSLFGRIRAPAGDIVYLRSAEVLTVPDRADIQVSPRTVAFFLDPTDVEVSLTTREVPES